ncbi:unnamed protein product [Lactuca saligna]|uniref:Uncharacterized protein n=1 Tax=Lactuca saligna TaxID=75948 RepID=A0AA35ZFD5_LACSI|nr:unnamed protein product [Lactuca saligna]
MTTNLSLKLPLMVLRFRKLITSHPLSELKTHEEVAAATNSKEEANIEESEGEAHPDTVDKPSKPVSEGVTEAKEVEAYIAIREELYKKAKESDSKIIDFKTTIRRHYFHVRPLNVTELETWQNYINFMEGGDVTTSKFRVGICDSCTNNSSI